MMLEIFAAVIGAVIAYLLFAFVAFDLNAGNWAIELRGGCVLGAVFLSIFGVIVSLYSKAE